MSRSNDMNCGCPSYKKESILTLDGGGIRGLVSLLILQQILLYIQAEEHECDKRLVAAGHHAPRADDRDSNELPLACHYFSFMFGTSTGGIIAIMLGRLRMSIKDCIATYCSLGGEVFGKKQPFHFLGQNRYDCAKLERIIREVVRRNGGNPNHDPLMADPSVLNKSHEPKAERVQNRCIPCRVGVFAVQSDSRSGTDEKIHMFRSYFNETPQSDGGLEDLITISLHRQRLDIPIWKIARATSAAPTYFRPIEVDDLRLMDGGIIANNPSQLARAEVNSMHRFHPSGRCRPPKSAPDNGTDGIRFLVSLGTGKQASQHITGNLLSLIKFALKQMTNPEIPHRSLQSFLDSKVYYRFNVEKDLRKMKLDECIVKGGVNLTFVKIEKAVQEYFEDRVVKDRARALARELVEHRRARRNSGHEWFRNLTVPGPPPSRTDDRYRSEDNGLPNGNNNGTNNRTTNGAITSDRRGSLPEPLHGAVELHTPVPEIPTGLMIPELAPGSPIQNSTHSLPTSPTNIPFDSANPPREEWSGSSPQNRQYHIPR